MTAAGHVFVVQADLAQLVCDEVLIPTDGGLDVGSHWDALHPLRDRRLLPQGWSTGAVRVSDRLPAVDGLPARRMVNSGATAHDDVAWLLETVDQALAVATDQLATTTSDTGRARPLLALPVVGTGAGGYHARRGEVLDGLLTRCRDAASRTGVDVALVCHARSDLTAVQARRSMLDGAGSSPLARRLGQLARAQELALFVGAGVSVGAGLPDWSTLLQRVAESDSRTTSLPARWTAADDLWDRAAQLRDLLGEEGLAGAVDVVLTQSRFALSHALLASLPGREAVTTNFDALFESARASRATPRLQVLPYSRGGEAYLLKLHGDAKLRDVVLDRQALEDYDVGRRPLAGLLQGLLLTRHLLFVGCSMQDENVVRNVDEVAALVRRYGHVDTVGTVLTLWPDQQLQEDWEAKGFTVEAVADPEAPTAQAARELEVLLDQVLLAATYDEGGHLLDERYLGLLSDESEQELARTLRDAAARLPTTRQWEGLRRALEAHGAGPA